MIFAWTINADPSFDPVVIIDLDAALQEWSNLIDGKGTLTVALKLATINSGRAQGGVTSAAYSGLYDPSNNNISIVDTSGLYKLLTGSSEPGATSDITITIDPTYLTTRYLDPKPGYTTVPLNQADLTEVFAHEIGHGLGMTGYIPPGGSSVPGQIESEYDANVSFIGGKPYFVGANAEKVYGGPVPLTFGGPSSVAGYDEDIYHLGNSSSDPVIGNDVMNGSYLPFGNTQVSTLDAAIINDLITTASRPKPGVLIRDMTLSQDVADTLTHPYVGPVAGLQSEFVDVTSHNLNITATKSNMFIHTGNGADAVVVLSGRNVVDGGGGSNFLTGGTGTDTFFVDTRGASQDIWSTVKGFHFGDDATMWGILPSSAKISWVDGDGAVGAKGLTLHASLTGGRVIASLTLAGFSTADLASGRLTTSFGHNGGGDYLYVHA